MRHNLLNLFAFFENLDFIALGIILAAWGVMGSFIERDRPHAPSTHALIAEYRFRWMVVLIPREVRMVDANILVSLRQGTNFFTSPSPSDQRLIHHCCLTNDPPRNYPARLDNFSPTYFE
ncbi:MAG: DUF599 family protein [Paracoccaceae bacterium]